MKATIGWHKNNAPKYILAKGREIGAYQKRFFNEFMMVKKIIHPDGDITWKLRESRLRAKCRDMVTDGVGTDPNYMELLGDWEGFVVPWTPERQATMILIRDIVEEEIPEVAFGFYFLPDPALPQYDPVADEMAVLAPTCMVRTKPHRGGFKKDMEVWTETLTNARKMAAGLPICVYVRAMKKPQAGGGPMSDDQITTQVKMTLDILPEAHIVVSGKDLRVPDYMQIAHDIIACPCVDR